MILNSLCDRLGSSLGCHTLDSRGLVRNALDLMCHVPVVWIYPFIQQDIDDRGSIPDTTSNSKVGNPLRRHT